MVCTTDYTEDPKRERASRGVPGSHEVFGEQKKAELVSD